MQYTVKKGRHTGRILTPWRDKDGLYVASVCNREGEYARTASLTTLANLSHAGLRIRMHAEGIAPYLVHPD